MRILLHEEMNCFPVALKHVLLSVSPMIRQRLNRNYCSTDRPWIMIAVELYFNLVSNLTQKSAICCKRSIAKCK